MLRPVQPGGHAATCKSLDTACSFIMTGVMANLIECMSGMLVYLYLLWTHACTLIHLVIIIINTMHAVIVFISATLILLKVPITHYNDSELEEELDPKQLSQCDL